jgi:hypothetical protein
MTHLKIKLHNVQDCSCRELHNVQCGGMNSTIQNTSATAQVNYTFNSLKHLAEWADLIAAKFRSGNRVFIERAGYGSTQYALLNAPRHVNGESVTWDMDAEGLPASWVKAIRRIISSPNTQ